MATRGQQRLGSAGLKCSLKVIINNKIAKVVMGIITYIHFERDWFS